MQSSTSANTQTPAGNIASQTTVVTMTTQVQQLTVYENGTQNSTQQTQQQQTISTSQRVADIDHEAEGGDLPSTPPTPPAHPPSAPNSDVVLEYGGLPTPPPTPPPPPPAPKKTLGPLNKSTARGDRYDIDIASDVETKAAAFEA